MVFPRMKREIDLSEEQVRDIIALAKKENTRDYLIFRLMPFFRVGEVMGSEPRKWDKTLKKWFPVEPTLPGLLVQDLQDDGIWVQGKGWKRKENPAPPVFMPFSPELVKELRLFIGNRKTGRIFEPIFQGGKYNQNSVRRHSRRYAKMVGVSDWQLVHPHRFRHFGITKTYKDSGKDVRAAREFGRHKNIATTMRYIQKFTPEERKETNLRLEKI